MGRDVESGRGCGWTTGGGDSVKDLKIVFLEGSYTKATFHKTVHAHNSVARRRVRRPFL